MNGEGGDGGGGAGGGEEDPSRLRVEKVGISALPKDITRRLPEVEGGDRRWQSGRRAYLIFVANATNGVSVKILK